MNQYEKLMRRCLTLAKKGEGRVNPNPMVGAVIFDDDFNIISEGYHQYWGGPHAEVNAINNAPCSLKGKNIAVNLEPCSHYGKTPPCADLLIKHGFKKVIAGICDPNPKVCGKGIKKLKEAGIEVITDILKDECIKLNEVFFKNQIEHKPFITIKSAVTLDGKIATKTGSSKWITGEKARKEVQKLRNKYDAVLTGSNTIMLDNPSLTCRLKQGINPARIIIDSKLKTNPKSNVYIDDKTKIFILTDKNADVKKLQSYPKNVEFIKCSLVNNFINLHEAIEKLYEKGIKSILAECGSGLNYALTKENLADKLILFTAPKIAGDSTSLGFVEGFNVSDINSVKFLKHHKTILLKPDIMSEYYFC